MTGAATRPCLSRMLPRSLRLPLAPQAPSCSNPFLFGKKRICADWLREIFADIGGIKKSNIGTDRIIAAIKTEIPEKYRKHSRKIKGSKPRSHPTWDYRLMCMEKESDINMVFEMVCRDCGVRDIRFSERLRRVFVTAEWKKRNNVVA